MSLHYLVKLKSRVFFVNSNNAEIYLKVITLILCFPRCRETIQVRWKALTFFYGKFIQDII